MNQNESEIATVFRFFNEIGIIAQLSGAAFEKVMPDGMTLPQFVVLNHLVRLGGDRTPVQIARAMQVTKGAMTNTLGHLDRGGMITVTPDPVDKRAKRVNLTDRGRDRRQAAIDAMTPELQAVAGAIDPADLVGVLPLIETIRAFLDRRRN